MPEPVFLFALEFIIGFEDGEIVGDGTSAELLFPLFHLFAVPAHHTALVNTERGIRYHKMLVDAHHLAKALALRACSSRRIEREHIVVGLFKLYAITLEACGEVIA